MQHTLMLLCPPCDLGEILILYVCLLIRLQFDG